MLRSFAPWALATVLLLGCGPNARCSGAQPNFVVLLKLAARPLPSDTVVHVTYGGSGVEDYRLSEPNAVHEVVFCRPAKADGSPVDALQFDAGGEGSAADAGASSGTDEATAVYCELWTGGFTKLQVTASTLPTSSYELARRDKQCTVTETIVLDSPDAG